MALAGAERLYAGRQFMSGFAGGRTDGGCHEVWAPYIG
jgi:hypothetical protein